MHHACTCTALAALGERSGGANTQEGSNDTSGRAPVVLQALDYARVLAHGAAHGVALIPAHDLHGQCQPHPSAKQTVLQSHYPQWPASTGKAAARHLFTLPPCTRSTLDEAAGNGLNQAKPADQAPAQLRMHPGRRAPRAAGAQGPARARAWMSRAHSWRSLGSRRKSAARAAIIFSSSSRQGFEKPSFSRLSSRHSLARALPGCTSGQNCRGPRARARQRPRAHPRGAAGSVRLP